MVTARTKMPTPAMIFRGRASRLRICSGTVGRTEVRNDQELRYGTTIPVSGYLSTGPPAFKVDLAGNRRVAFWPTARAIFLFQWRRQYRLDRALGNHSFGVVAIPLQQWKRSPGAQFWGIAGVPETKSPIDDSTDPLP